MNSDPQNPMAETIRQRFDTSGLSIKKLAELSDVPYASAHGLMNGTRDALLMSAHKMCEVLGLELSAKEGKSR